MPGIATSICLVELTFPVEMEKWANHGIEQKVVSRTLVAIRSSTLKINSVRSVIIPKHRGPPPKFLPSRQLRQHKSL